MARAPANPNETTLNNFISAMHQQPRIPNGLNSVMATFARKATVGITNYGPQFAGFAEIQKLFRQLFFAFPDLHFAEQPSNERLFSTDKTMIATQVILAGSHQGVWFAKGTPYYSPPLSNIVPDASRMMNLDACAVFTFDDAHKIIQLAIYFDRYLMAQQLAPVSGA